MAQKQRPLNTLLRLANFSGQVEACGSRAQVLLPGFSPDDFDRTGNLSVWRLQHLTTIARIFVYHVQNPSTGQCFLQYDELTRDRFTFMGSVKTSIDRSYYTLPDDVIVPRLAMNIHLGYVGGASLNTVAQLVDKETGFVFAKNTNQVVLVDKTTRKPTLIPDWWKQRYMGKVVGGEKLVVQVLEAPSDDKCHHYDVKVAWSDIDNYKHTTYVAYIRYCFNAAMDAVNKGLLTKMSNDLLLYPTKHMEMAYKGESVANDQLVVKCWEDDHNPYLLHFHISRQDKVIFQNSIEFFKPGE